MTLTKSINLELLNNKEVISTLNCQLAIFEKIFYYDYLSKKEENVTYAIKSFYSYLIEFCLNNVLFTVLKEKNFFKNHNIVITNWSLNEIKIEYFDLEKNIWVINDVLQVKNPKIYSSIEKEIDKLVFVSRIEFLGRYKFEINLKLAPIKNDKEVKNCFEILEGYIKASIGSKCIFKGKIVEESNTKLYKLKQFMYILSEGLIDELEKIGREEILKKFFNIDSLTRYALTFRLKLTNNSKYVLLNDLGFFWHKFLNLVNQLSESWKSQYENIEYISIIDEVPFNKLDGSKKLVTIKFKSRTSPEEMKITFNLLGKSINNVDITSPQKIFSEIRRNRLLIDIEFTLSNNKKYKANFVPKDIFELYITLFGLLGHYIEENKQDLDSWIKTDVFKTNISNLLIINRVIPYRERSSNTINLKIIENSISLNTNLSNLEIKKIVEEKIKDIEYKEDKEKIEIVFETKSYYHLITIDYHKKERKLFFEWCIKNKDKEVFNLCIPFEVIAL